jgi:hypothetical protein
MKIWMEKWINMDNWKTWHITLAISLTLAIDIAAWIGLLYAMKYFILL